MVKCQYIPRNTITFPVTTTLDVNGEISVHLQEPLLFPVTTTLDMNGEISVHPKEPHPIPSDNNTGYEW